MAASKIDQKEYLKKYLSKDADKTKKKKKKFKVGVKKWNKHSDSDLSPPRKAFIPEEKPNKIKKVKKTLTSVGLLNLESLKREIEEQKKKEKVILNKTSKLYTNLQEIVVRDRRTGRKRNLDDEASKELKKKKEQDMINEKYAVWGKGLKQVEKRDERLMNDFREMNKPLARYANDQDLELELQKSRHLLEDPMIKYFEEKKIKDGVTPQDKLQYQGTFMPNRFGIKPGYRWDGVDRSNMYEKKWMDAQNLKKAIEDEAYKWSTADM